MQNETLEKYQILAERYVNALTQIADERDMWDIINDDLSKITNLLQENAELENFLLHPVISTEDKKDVIEKVIKSSVSEIVFDFLNIILEKNRFYLIPSIKDFFKKELLKKNNIINAYVTTAIELDKDMENSLIERLTNKLQKTINIIPKIDQNIIGGVILQIDDKIIDGSIKTKIDNMKKQLI